MQVRFLKLNLYVPRFLKTSVFLYTYLYLKKMLLIFFQCSLHIVYVCIDKYYYYFIRCILCWSHHIYKIFNIYNTHNIFKGLFLHYEKNASSLWTQRTKINIMSYKIPRFDLPKKWISMQQWSNGIQCDKKSQFLEIPFQWY